MMVPTRTSGTVATFPQLADLEESRPQRNPKPAPSHQRSSMMLLPIPNFTSIGQLRLVRKRKAKLVDLPLNEPIADLPPKSEATPDIICKSSREVDDALGTPARLVSRKVERKLNDGKNVIDLTKESVNDMFKSLKANDIVLVYPKDTKGAIKITKADFDRLSPRGWLNDVIIEFGARHIMSRLQLVNPSVDGETFLFSSFFYEKLTSPKGGYSSVKKWTANQDIFKKTYLVIPINDKYHWYLAIIYRPGNLLPSAELTHGDIPSTTQSLLTNGEVPLEPRTVIFLMDSVNQPHLDVAKVLETYLVAEALDKKGTVTTLSNRAVGHHLKVPAQPNHCDCGLYLLHFMECFLNDPEPVVKSFLPPISPLSLRDFWMEESIGTRRESMIRAICDLASSQA